MSQAFLLPQHQQTQTDSMRHMNNDVSVKIELQGRQRGKQRHSKSMVSRGSRKREDTGQPYEAALLQDEWFEQLKHYSVKTVMNDIRVDTPDICWENSLWCLHVTSPSSERWSMLDSLDWSRRFTVDIVCESVTTPSHASTMITGPM